MTVFLNGHFVPAESASVSVFDRGFLYGDGLFETVRAHAGRLFLWAEHLDRLRRGCAALGLQLPLPEAELRGAADELLVRNHHPDAVLRLTLSRGVGRRGYSPRGADQPTLVLSTHPAPSLVDPPPGPWQLRTSGHRLTAGDPLTRLKSASKLLHVLARAEVEALGADEALILNQDGQVAEAASANVFWFDGPAVRTPGLDLGALDGITRGFVLGLIRRSGGVVHETAARPEALRESGGVFLTLSSLGLVEVGSLDGFPLRRDPRLADLREAYRAAIRLLISG